MHESPYQSKKRLFREKKNQQLQQQPFCPLLLKDLKKGQYLKKNCSRSSDKRRSALQKDDQYNAKQDFSYLRSTLYYTIRNYTYAMHTRVYVY